MCLGWKPGCSKAKCPRCGVVHFAAALVAVAFVLGVTAHAQMPQRPVRVGVLIGGIAPAALRGSQAFLALRDAFAQLGYREGQTLLLEGRSAERQTELGGPAQELVQLRVDVIVAGGVAAARAAKGATQTIPIVGVAVGGDPVAQGLAQSIAHPAGNFTGFLHAGPNRGKLLQLLKEAVPGVTRAGLVWNPDNPAIISGGFLESWEAAGREAGLSLRLIRARSIEELDTAFATLVAEKIRAAFVNSDALWLTQSNRAAAAAQHHRIAAIWGHLPIAEAGGLIAYAPDIVDQFRQAAGYVKRILDGTRPGDLPLQYPNKWTLVANLKTAKAIGVALSPAILNRADRVIE